MEFCRVCGARLLMLVFSQGIDWRDLSTLKISFAKKSEFFHPNPRQVILNSIRKDHQTRKAHTMGFSVKIGGGERFWKDFQIISLIISANFTVFPGNLKASSYWWTESSLRQAYKTNGSLPFFLQHFFLAAICCDKPKAPKALKALKTE